MKYTPSRKFSKNIKKLSPKQKTKVFETIRLWEINPNNAKLHDHGLLGTYKGYRSLNVGGDLRLVYRQVTATQVLLYDIGTHAQLYN